MGEREPKKDRRELRTPEVIQSSLRGMYENVSPQTAASRALTDIVELRATQRGLTLATQAGYNDLAQYHQKRITEIKGTMSALRGMSPIYNDVSKKTLADLEALETVQSPEKAFSFLSGLHTEVELKGEMI